MSPTSCVFTCLYPVSLQPGLLDGHQVVFGWFAQNYWFVRPLAFDLKDGLYQAGHVPRAGFPPSWYSETSCRACVCHTIVPGAVGGRDWFDLRSNLYLWQHGHIQGPKGQSSIFPGDAEESQAGNYGGAPGRCFCFVMFYFQHEKDWSTANFLFLDTSCFHLILPKKHGNWGTLLMMQPTTFWPKTRTSSQVIPACGRTMHLRPTHLILLAGFLWEQLTTNCRT